MANKKTTVKRKIEKKQDIQEQNVQLKIGNELYVMVQLLDMINKNIVALIKEVRDGR